MKNRRLGKTHRMVTVADGEVNMRCTDCGLEQKPGRGRRGGFTPYSWWRMPGKTWKQGLQPRPCPGKERT